MNEERVEIEMFSLTKEKLIHCYYSNLLFTEDYLIRSAKYDSEKPNEDTDVMEEIHVEIDYLVFKEFVTGIDINYYSVSECHGIRVCIDGTDDLVIYFKTLEGAKNVRDKVLQWKLKKRLWLN